ncbi:hypothetical protein BDB01DRAFT_728148 [Pilobolus umbonatus]|nr:hypothetical protein BDB01DRAFT_728148 [Pilobolus umbonatus]
MTPPSVKQLIPSLSSLNIPLVIDVTPETPPPQFAVESRKNKLKIGTRKNTIQKAYPSAFDTFLFDDSSPGKPNVGIKPVKLLIERLEAWYTNSYKKQNYQDTHPSRRLLQIHFAYTEGFRGVCNAWESYHTNSVKDHSEFATFLRTEAIPVLTNIKRELKWMIDSIRTDDRLSLSNLTNLKAVAAKKLKCLDRQLVFFDENPYHGYNKQDPWLMNACKIQNTWIILCCLLK